MSTGWESLPGEFPWPPANGQVLSPMFVGALDIRWDDPAELATGVVSPITQATGSITMLGIPVTQEDASGTLTVNAGVVAGDTVQIANIMFTGVAGPRTPGSNDFDVSLPSTNAIASDLADAINDAANDMDGLVVASEVGNVITLSPMDDGAAGNDITLASSTPSIVLSGDTLTGGVDPDYLVLGGVAYLVAVTGPRTSGANDFSVDGNTFDVANSIADAINDSANIFRGIVTATSQFGAVTLTAVPLGYAGNAIAVESSNALVFRLSGSTLTDGLGDPNCKGQSNATWNIVGVNIYRSDNGERGPYIRLNRFPIGSMFYRDATDNIFMENEIVQWDSAWVSKSDSSNNRKWAFRTIFCPVVKATPTPPLGVANRIVATYANAPSDVIVRINGVVVPVDTVFGPNGEITLINQPVYDLATEKFIPAVLPAEDGSSEVTVSYWYNQNLVKTDLDRTTQIMYRLTTVALDPTSPTGYNETPLGYSPPLRVANVETLDYMWKEAIRRNTWILEQGGERVKLFKRKVSGIPCPCRVDEQTLTLQKQPEARCLTCFGTGWVGGYDGPIDIIIAPDEAERNVRQTPTGRKLDHVYEVWTGPSPALTQRDFLVKQTGERYSIGPVRRPAVRGLPLQQHFNIGYLDDSEVRYLIPVNGLTELPWPQTRPTDPNTPCNDAVPNPVGFDYQATPMETEKGNIPEGREQRGRTPVWSNITY